MTATGWVLAGVHAVLVYAWILFPALLSVFGRRREQDVDGPAVNPPRIAFVLSAFNEQGHIGPRIANLLATDYPKKLWVAYIGVDGSKDRTAEEARRSAEGQDNIFVIEFANNRGKVAVLKDLVTRAADNSPQPDILIFTDANTAFEKDAVHRLCRPFSDPRVGGVCGRLRFIRGKGTETQENVYWRLENWLKARESAIDSCLGANGAIYAVRAPLFWRGIPSNTIIDDFVIGMKVREQNYRVIYESRALAAEELPANLKDEWKRRVRIGAGDFQALNLCRRCLGPSYGAFAWMFWSHKVLRWFTPHLLIAGILLALFCGFGERAWFGLMFVGFYAALGLAALLGRWSRTQRGPLRLLGGTEYLLAMQIAIFAGFLRFCRGNLEGRWQTTARN